MICPSYDRKRRTTFHVQKQPQEPRHPDGGHLTWGLPFGYGHPQKRNLYISVAVFVGKYRHVSDPWKSGVGVMNLLGHSVALWLRCGWAAFVACAACVNYVYVAYSWLWCGDNVVSATPGCYTWGTATDLTEWAISFFPLLHSCWVRINRMFTDYWDTRIRNGISVVEHNCRVEMFG